MSTATIRQNGHETTPDCGQPAPATTQTAIEVFARFADELKGRCERFAEQTDDSEVGFRLSKVAIFCELEAGRTYNRHLPPIDRYGTLDEGQFIEAADWAALSADERERVRKCLALRELELYESAQGDVTVIASGAFDWPAQACVHSETYVSIRPDPRVRFSDDIEFHVFNIPGDKDASRMVREFLRDLLAVGF